MSMVFGGWSVDNTRSAGGTVKGWTSASFLAPFLLSVVLFPLFFLWERRLPDERAVLPIGVWRLPNLPLLAFAAWVQRAAEV